MVPSDLDIEAAADAVYAILNEEVYQLLVIDCGWTLERFRAWLSDLVRQQLIPTTRRGDRRAGGAGLRSRTMADESPFVLVEHPRPHVAVVRMHRPDRLNAMSIELVIGAARRPRRRRPRRTTRGWSCSPGRAGPSRSGLDLKDHGIVPNIDGLQVGRIAQRAMRHYSRLVPLLRRMPQPVIAAVNGPAYGGGMCLALGADLRFAAESADLQQHRHRQRAHLHRARARRGCSRG